MSQSINTFVDKFKKIVIKTLTDSDQFVYSYKDYMEEYSIMFCSVIGIILCCVLACMPSNCPRVYLVVFGAVAGVINALRAFIPILEIQCQEAANRVHLRTEQYMLHMNV